MSKPDATITRVTAVRGTHNEQWVVFGIWFGEERPVFSSPDPSVAARWARMNGWGA